MTLDEAIKIAEIIEEADSGCPVCVRELVEKLQVAFPAFDWDCDEGIVYVTQAEDFDGQP